MQEEPLKKRQPEKLIYNLFITEDIEKIVHDAQVLLAYVAKSGVSLSKETIDSIIKAKFCLQKKEWNPEIEMEFWGSYQQLSDKVYPVTVESLKAKKGYFDDKGKFKHSNAHSAVQYYRYYSVITLCILLATQVFWIMGNHVSTNLKDFLEKRTEIAKSLSLKGVDVGSLHTNLENDKTDDDLTKKVEINNFILDYADINQRLNANYATLLFWNNIWKTALFIDDSDDEYYTRSTFYDYYKSTQQLEALNNILDKKEDLLRQENNDPNLNFIKIETDIHNIKDSISTTLLLAEKEKAKQHLYVELETAEYVLMSLNLYFLPLLYGLLGSIIYVLRVISAEIKQSIYTKSSEIKYRIRLSLGSLAGMTVGWFLIPSEVGISNLSSLSIAFLAGYNVEVLFSQMDRLIANFSKEGQSLRNDTTPIKYKK